MGVVWLLGVRVVCFVRVCFRHVSGCVWLRLVVSGCWKGGKWGQMKHKKPWSHPLRLAFFYFSTV